MIRVSFSIISFLVLKMTSSNHILVVSDEDYGRSRKTSASSLDSWEGIGLDDEYASRAHPSRSKPHPKVRVTPKYEPQSATSTSGDCVKNVLVPRNMQSRKYVQHGTGNVQQTSKYSDENRLKSSRHFKPTTADQVIWYSEGNEPHRSDVLKPRVQGSKPHRTFAPAAHLFRAERIGRTQGSTDSRSEDTTRMLSEQQASSVDQTEKMKAKIMSVWNNMKYGWSSRTKPSFSSVSPIHFLGVTYEDQNKGESSYEKFLLDFSSRVWLTYRRDFPVLEDSLLTTDCGWGCMLRSGQMMLAQALVTHFLGRGWRLKGVPASEKSDLLYRMILRWFGDLPCTNCPFSLHTLVANGKSVGKKAGDWYGPASVAYILKQAMEDAAAINPCLDDVCVYVAQDCTVYKEDVIELCIQPSRIKKFHECNVIHNSPFPPPHRKKLPVALPPSPTESVKCIDWKEALIDEPVLNCGQSPVSSVYSFVSRGTLQSPPKSPLFRTSSNPFLATTSERSPLPSMGQSSIPSGTSLDCLEETRDRWRSLVVLVPVRLGGERLNKIYFPCIFRLLAHECSIGIIGGRPRHSLYFVGFQDDKLINLDPHYCQEVVDVTKQHFPVDTFQCTDPRKIPITKMDPSCTIGFYFKTRDDFEKFTENVESLLSSDDGKCDYPVFIVSPRSSKVDLQNPSGIDVDEQLYENSSDFNGDDFVLI